MCCEVKLKSSISALVQEQNIVYRCFSALRHSASERFPFSKNANKTKGETSPVDLRVARKLSNVLSYFTYCLLKEINLNQWHAHVGNCVRTTHSKTKTSISWTDHTAPVWHIHIITAYKICIDSTVSNRQSTAPKTKCTVVVYLLLNA